MKRSMDHKEIRLTSFIKGNRTDEGLAYLQNHGEWIEWLAEAHSG